MIQLINTKIRIKSSTYIDSSKKINYKDPKLKIGDIVIKIGDSFCD